MERGKDDNAATPHFNRRTLLVFRGVDYKPQRHTNVDHDGGELPWNARNWRN